MPTIDIIGPYRLFFYSAEGTEPPHVRVRRDRATEKFWLNPVRLARSRWFSDYELRSLQKPIEANRERILETAYPGDSVSWRQRILETWNEHFHR